MTIHKQLITFALIGVLNTAVDTALYTLLIWLQTPLLLAIITSTIAGMICSYFLNRRFTFKTNRQPIVQFIYITVTGLLDFTANCYMATDPTVWNNRHLWSHHRKTSCH